MTLQVEVVAVTHRGRAREQNEDAAGIAGWTITGEEPAIIATEVTVSAAVELVVADGLGGHLGGETASRTAVSAFFAAHGSLVDRIAAADDAVHSVADDDPGLSDLATTFVGVQLHPDGKICVFNIGDSRMYRYAGGALGLLSVDDSHPDGTVTQVLGGGRRVVLDPHLYDEVLAQDVLLVCSDGLTRVLDDSTIAELLARPLPEAARQLLDRVLEGGAPDNVTFILCRGLTAGDHNA